MIELYHPEPTTDEILLASQEVAESRVLAKGGQIEKFERTLGEIVGAKHVTAVANGTVALHTAIKAMGWGRGDRILTSPYSFIATSNALLFEDCVPIFGSVTKGLQLNLEHAYAILEKDPTIKGIVLPHIFGHRVDIDGLQEIKDKLPGIGIIEDASQTLASADYGLGVGVVGDIVTYSFHENKIITTFGEGGAITTNDSILASKIKALRQHGRIDQDDWLDKIDLGYNYRLTEVQAALGSKQLDRLAGIMSRRRFIAEQMLHELSDNGIELPDDVLRSWFGFYVVLKSSSEAQFLSDRFAEKNIQSRTQPMPALTQFNHNRKFESHDNLIAARAASVVMLPMHTRLTEDNIRYIANTARATIREIEGSVYVTSSGFYDSIARDFERTRLERKNYLSTIENLSVDAISEQVAARPMIIDIGCGDGIRGQNIATRTNGSLVSIDSSAGMVEVAKTNGLDAHCLDISKESGVSTIGKFNSALLLWNVLGHMSEAERRKAFKNIFQLLLPGGQLIIDVNNLFNESQYGYENAQRNRQLVIDGLSTGNFLAKRDSKEESITTTTHIFHVDEVIKLVTSSGFTIDTLAYVNYETGDLTDEANGQIFVIAKKPEDNQ